MRREKKKKRRALVRRDVRLLLATVHSEGSPETGFPENLAPGSDSDNERWTGT